MVTTYDASRYEDLKDQATPPIVAAEGRSLHITTISKHTNCGRKYLPTLSDLIDRLTITVLKMVFIPEHRDEYLDERRLIEHDIDLMLNERAGALGAHLKASDVVAVTVMAIANHTIWLNESKARAGGTDQDKLLKFTHSINGCRNTAKNAIARACGERMDHKVDCYAADIPTEYGNWRDLI